jgi:hypothetical protein
MSFHRMLFRLLLWLLRRGLPATIEKRIIVFCTAIRALGEFLSRAYGIAPYYLVETRQIRILRTDARSEVVYLPHVK